MVASWELGHKPIIPALERQTQEEQVFETCYMRPSLKLLSPPKKNTNRQELLNVENVVCGVRNIKFRIT